VTFNDLNLNKPLLKALADLEFEYPTPIQEKAFPKIMSGCDLVGIAQTGTGKTLAYLLPILRQLTYSDQRDARVLILVPTRELVLQVAGEISKLTAHSTIRVGAVYGGSNINTQKKLIYDGLDVIVATPGRLFDLNLTGVLRFKNIQRVVIDEVDEMLNLGFRVQIMNILERLPERRQNLMFSATLTPDVQALISAYFQNPLTIEIAVHGTPIEKIVQKAYRVPNFATKVNLLENLLLHDPDLSKVLVFVATKKMADRLFEQIDSRFPEKAGVIHSNKSQNFRIRTLQEFTGGQTRLLIATDIIARGLDITDVTHVINFDIPDLPADYIHRIGRTGRADKDGIAISFVSDAEKAYFNAIEELMHRSIEILPLPGDVQVSTVYLEEERPTRLFDIDYLKPKMPKVQKENDDVKNERQSKKKKPAQSKKSNLRFVNKHKSNREPKPRF
jgi:ATP-dependent RNA helicase RhlE